ncbi:MAG TPA: CPBP family intramembrane glutamic endopeptidase [Clostridia bacterium]|nr:CPBP family intramembrane glutamic endopeptidase [Clostridia bacterium]
MSTIAPRQVCLGLAVLFVFLIPYTLGWTWGCWKFVSTCAGIVLLWRWARPKGFAADLGIRLCRADFTLAVVLLLVVGMGAHRLIPGILQQHGYIRGQHDLIWMFLVIPFQVLNEEMVLRALLLTALARILRPRFFLSAVVAGLFALLHFTLYRFGPPHTALSISALTTLFLVGFALNELFLATGSIAAPWAIHFGWNLTRYGSDWIGETSSGTLPQGLDFNLIEGNVQVAALALALAVVVSALRFRAAAHGMSGNVKSVQ